MAQCARHCASPRDLEINKTKPAICSHMSEDDRNPLEEKKNESLKKMNTRADSQHNY